MCAKKCKTKLLFFCIFSDIDDCAEIDNVCSNHGNCIDQINSYRCECHENYKGVNCEIVITDTPTETPTKIPTNVTILFYFLNLFEKRI